MYTILATLADVLKSALAVVCLFAGILSEPLTQWMPDQTTVMQAAAECTAAALHAICSII